MAFAALRALVNRVVVRDARFSTYCDRHQARTVAGQALYLAAFLLPGMVAYTLVNVEAVNRGLSRAFGFTGYDFQYWAFVVFTLGWHLAFPVLMVRYREKLPWPQVWEFLSLDRFSYREVLLVAPLAFALSVAVSLPYMMTLYTPFQAWLSSIPAFRIPPYSMFSSYQAFYGAPVPLMVLMLIGNFIGEEVYFRGYLFKKTAFLGRWTGVVNSVLFCAYHLWQVPQSWPLIVPFLFFGPLMQARKNLYTLIMFHLLFNLGGVQIYQVILQLGAGARH